jgi:hypothetical protein
MERFWHQEQIRAFEGVQPRYELLQKALEQVLNRLRKEWSPLAIHAGVAALASLPAVEPWLPARRHALTLIEPV